MSIRLGDIAPDFEQESSVGRIRFHEWLGDSWGILFSHPADFTPVCTTELGFTAKLKDAFTQRGVKAIALSVDPVDSHLQWIEDIKAINVRNPFKGTIKEIVLGDVLSEIDVQTAAGIVTSVITTRSVKELELAVGSEVIAFVKSTEVSIAKL